jgi:hypothetical protein
MAHSPHAVESFPDRRRLRRIQITVPVKVRGTNSKGIEFVEMSRSINLNADGALLLLREEVKTGARLRLFLPLPRSMQKTAVSKPVYETEALVVRIEASEAAGQSQVAVRFQRASSKAYYQEAS